MTKEPIKVALITGITGQDGAYLADLLLKKGYEVHGFKRRASSSNTTRLVPFKLEDHKDFYIHYGDMTDTSSIMKVIKKVTTKITLKG